MRQITLIAQTSLEGFVAGLKGEFDNFIGGEENLEFVCTLITDADTTLVGRNSYELLNADWPNVADQPGATTNMIKYSNWYNAATKIVVSKTLNPTKERNTIIIKENILAEITKMKEQDGKNILVFG